MLIVLCCDSARFGAMVEQFAFQYRTPWRYWLTIDTLQKGQHCVFKGGSGFLRLQYDDEESAEGNDFSADLDILALLLEKINKSLQYVFGLSS